MQWKSNKITLMITIQYSSEQIEQMTEQIEMHEKDQMAVQD